MHPSLRFHRGAHGKIAVHTTVPIASKADLSLTYTPGVAVPALAIARDPTQIWELTGRRNRVAIVTDGSAVLGLGNIGPEAALPVMEGKAALMKEFADIDAFPLCCALKRPERSRRAASGPSVEELVDVIATIAPSFGGILLEDIAAPRCFEVEELLKKTLNIPVFHDDQHGTAVVVLAGLMNAMRVRGTGTGTGLDSKVVISGAGAAGTAVARMLLSQGFRNILIADSKGIISRKRGDLSAPLKQTLRVASGQAHKTFLAAATNPENIAGTLADAMRGADVFIGVSAPGIVSEGMVRSMNENPIVFAMANPDPEIPPDAAKRAGARVVATGRSDFPNQVNNLLAFPGIFRGALDAKANAITEAMELAAAKALAGCVAKPTPERILPDPLDRGVVKAVAEAVARAA